MSTPDQDPGYRVQALQGRGCERTFTDCCTGRKAQRSQLDAALEFLREGDGFVVWWLYRLARNLRLAGDNRSGRRVDPSPDPVWLVKAERSGKRKVFYVRISNSTRELSGADFFSYFRKRWD